MAIYIASELKTSLSVASDTACVSMCLMCIMYIVRVHRRDKHFLWICVLQYSNCYSLAATDPEIIGSRRLAIDLARAKLHYVHYVHVHVVFLYMYIMVHGVAPVKRVNKLNASTSCPHAHAQAENSY